MNHEWTPEIELDAAQTRVLLESRFPELAPVDLEPIGVGFDNSAWRVNREWVFRVPRRTIAAQLLAAEIEWLPILAPHLPLPVSAPVFSAPPGADFPFPVAGYPWLPGTTACRVELTSDQRRALAEPLGAFLKALHGVPVDDDARARAPTDFIGRADLLKREERIRTRLPEAATYADIDVHGLLARLAPLAGAAPWPNPKVFVHGDLYPRHVLLDPQARLAGVIDWGDLHLGDPALDLTVGWGLLDSAGRADMRAAYGGVDDHTWARARFRAVHYGVNLLIYGVNVGDDAMRLLGLRFLDEFQRR